MAGSMSEILSFIRDNRQFTVMSHTSPDGDTLGSALGLVHMLRAMGKEAEAVCSDPVPGIYSFLPGADEVQKSITKSIILICRFSMTRCLIFRVKTMSVKSVTAKWVWILRGFICILILFTLLLAGFNIILKATDTNRINVEIMNLNRVIWFIPVIFRRAVS